MDTPLSALRAKLATFDLDGFVVPRADEYQGEYVAPSCERLAWVTGFTGSAGNAVILADRAWLFVDGRYTIQAGQEVAGKAITVKHISDKPMNEVLAESLPRGIRLGYDPWLHSADQVVQLSKVCERAGVILVPVDVNPIDAVWYDRPALPAALLELHPVVFSGRIWSDKVADVTARMDVDAVVLSDPSSLAWLLNLRGGDVPFTPLPLGRAIVHKAGSVDVFVDGAKLTDAVKSGFSDSVSFKEPSAMIETMAKLAGRRVQVDGAQVPYALVTALEQVGATVVKAADPCMGLRAEKNAVELAGARSAHHRDGAAMVRFLAWLEGRADVDELQVAEATQHFRSQGEHFRDLSFPTIAGFGPNGAIVHYRSTPETNRRVEPGSFLLLDSGAQYLDGTTDITRTIAIGAVGEEERRRYTQVLKGNIAVSRAVFPAGTTGSQLDVLARLALWADGVDYDHGTGHGVGSYLSVHEGPQRISKAGNNVALKPGHILSNEPGYYKTGHYGIRLENLLAVREMSGLAGAERPALGFEVLTLVPFDLTAIEVDLLTKDEVDWLNQYHTRVLGEIGPLVDGSVAGWLMKATRPIFVKL